MSEYDMHMSNTSRSTGPHSRRRQGSHFSANAGNLAGVPTAAETATAGRGHANGTESAPVVPQPPTPQHMNISLKDLNGPLTGDSELGGAPPSPSTLTDIILSLHASLYGAKRQVGEIHEMVRRYYDVNAVFDSPLVSAHGRDRIIDQFVLAFALPGLEVRSELRDVICSDFEFDGTRAGIIDHTITVTFFPNLFGSSSQEQDVGIHTPGTSHGNVTPHPFLNYPTSAGHQGAYPMRRHSSGFFSSPRTPSTPFWQPSSSYVGGSNWNTRPRPPAIMQQGSMPSSQAQSSHLSLSPGVIDSHGASLPSPRDGVRATCTPVTPTTPVARMMSSPVPAMPVDAAKSHWNAPQGLGRRSVWSLLYDLLRPSQALRIIFSLELSLFSRLEFNESGRIVRHEDTWSVRELVVGMLPFFSLCMYDGCCA